MMLSIARRRSPWLLLLAVPVVVWRAACSLLRLPSDDEVRARCERDWGVRFREGTWEVEE